MLLECMKPAYGYLLIVVASIIWGTLGIIGKLILEYGVSPPTLIALRILLSSVALLLPTALFKRSLLKIKKKDVLTFLIFGLLAIALQRTAYFYAVDLTTVTIAAVVCYTYPIFVTVYASALLKEKVTSLTVLAAVITFLGVALVVKAYEASWFTANFIGVSFGFLSSILFALYVVIVKKLRENYNTWTIILYGDGIGALTLSPIVIFSLSEIANYPQQLWLLIFAIAWFSSLAAYVIYSYALKYVESSKGSILSFMEPLSAAIFSATFLGENFAPPQILGVTLSLIGTILLFYKPKIKTNIHNHTSNEKFEDKMVLKTL